MVAMVVASPVERLSHAVDELAAESIDTHATSSIGADLVALRREIDRLEAQFIRRVHRFDRTKGALAEGAPSTASWIRGTCGLTGAAAVERVRMARVLDELPLTRESFGEGRAPFSNVALIARLAADVGTEATRAVEQTLVTAAETVDAGRMHHLAVSTRHRIDADGVLDRDRRNHERRWFSCDQTYDGVFVVRGELDSAGGAMVKAALDAGSRPAGSEDDRTGSQRRADALVDMAAAMLRAGEAPSVHGQRPHLVLTTSLATLQRVPGAPPAELEGVGPIHAETARRLACDASRRVAVALAGAGAGATASVGVMPGGGAGAGAGDGMLPGARAGAGAGLRAGAATGGTGGAGGAAGVDRSVSIGRASRTIPPAMRVAIGLRDKGCRYPGCDRPLGWTDVHHIEHWADGGESSVANGVSICSFHHRFLHEDGRELRLMPDGTVEVSGPRARPPSSFRHRR